MSISVTTEAERKGASVGVPGRLPRRYDPLHVKRMSRNTADEGDGKGNSRKEKLHKPRCRSVKKLHAE